MENQSDQKLTSSSVLKKNIALNTIFRILMVIAPFITAPYVSRVLMSDGVGIYSYTSSLVSYFTMFAALGTAFYGAREIARKRDDKKEYSKIFFEIELISVLCSAASLLVWVIFAMFYAEYRTYMLILSLLLLATCLDISWLYAGLEKFKYTVPVNFFFKFLSVVLIFIFVKTSSDLWIYILIFAGSIFLGNASMWLFLPKVICKANIDKHSLKKHFKETLIYFIPTVAISLYTVLDKTLIGVLIQGKTSITNSDGTEEIKKISELENGYYEQATKIIDMVKVVAFASINTVMCSRACFLFEKEDKKAIKELTIHTFELTLLLSIGSMFGIIGVAGTFVPLFFGSGFDKTILLLQIISCLVPIICISGVFESTYYTPAGKKKQSAMFLIIGAIVNIILSIPLIIFFKSAGAAIASVIAESIIMVLYFRFCKGAITLKEFFNVVWRKILAGGLMLGTIILLTLFVKQYISNTLVFLAILFFSGLLVYFLVLLILKDQSLKIILGAIKKIKKQEPKVENKQESEESMKQ